MVKTRSRKRPVSNEQTASPDQHLTKVKKQEVVKKEKKTPKKDSPPEQPAVTTKAERQELAAVSSETKIEKEHRDKMARKMYVGAHISAAGGVHNAVTNAVSIGCKAFALFLKSQRQWNAKPLDTNVIQKFKDLKEKHGYSSNVIVPHGSYLMNCGSPDPALLAKSREALIEEMKRCEKLGLTLFNFHPGSTCGKQSVEESIKQIADCINDAHTQTSDVTAVIENMSCQGHTIGGKFEEIKNIIDQVKDKTRVGVCLDTCHAFAAGFDISTEQGYQDMMKQFESIIGLEYLKAMHINDSKGDLGCHLDRHELIGKGKIGISAFKRIMADSRLENIPLILETPDETAWEREIKMLYGFQCK